MDVNVTETLDGNSPVITVDTPKTNHSFIIRKALGGFVFYEVSVSRGKVPNALSGRYTTMRDALRATKDYIFHMSTSQTVQRDEKAKDRIKKVD